MSFLNTNTVADALVTTLKALTFTKVVGGTANLFEDVIKYDATDILDALRDTLKYSDRVGLVVPGRDRYVESGPSSSRFITKEKVQLFFIVFADQDVADGQEAFFGDGADRKGVVGMKDLTVAGIAGADLGLDQVAMQPLGGQPFEQWNESGNRKRKGWISRWETPAGVMQINRHGGLPFPS